MVTFESNSAISAWLADDIGTIEINRPEQKNAISEEMWLAFPVALQSLKDAGARVVIIKGKGNVFASGADLEELCCIRTFGDAERIWNAISQALNFVADFSLPTLAAVDGPCIGGGCLLAAACDLRYATPQAIFGVPIAKLGIVLDKDNLGRLAALLGVSGAKEIIFRGHIFGAAEALERGLVDGLVEQESFANAISAIAGEIKGNSPISISECKLALAGGSSDRRSLNEAHRAVISSYLSPEFQERSAKALKKS